MVPASRRPWRAQRMEYFIAMLWGVTAVCGIGLMVVYWTGGQAQLEGYLLLAAFGCLGAGLLLWAVTFCPAKRSPLSGTSTSRCRSAGGGRRIVGPGRRTDDVAARLPGQEGARTGGRHFRYCGAVAIGVARASPRQRALPHEWYPGARLVTEEGRAITVDDISVGGLLTVWPEGFIDSPESAAVVVNIGGAPVEARPGQEGFEVVSGANGLVAFSKVCTHAGCAVSLFNVLSMQLICPCHQSTFNILQDCKPVFGPASRPLPQLPMGVAPGGFLIARSDFIEPVGPGFWNRSGD